MGDRPGQRPGLSQEASGLQKDADTLCHRAREESEGGELGVGGGSGAGFRGRGGERQTRGRTGSAYSLFSKTSPALDPTALTRCPLPGCAAASALIHLEVR